jgi:ATP-binding cassette subfamily B protein
MVQPTKEFYESYSDEGKEPKSFRFLSGYLRPYRNLYVQLALGVILGGVLHVVFPFLFQAMVDNGVIIPNISFITTILIAQIILIAGRVSVEFIRNWIILHIGARVNIHLVSDYLRKMMRLPIAYFDNKLTGDIIQRIQDHQRIELFLTQTTLNLFYSIISIVILGLVLLIISLNIFLIFLGGSVLYVLWTLLFMNRRKNLDHKKFAQLSQNQSNIIQLVSGMQDIKLNNCERQKRWEWESIQASLFNISVKGLSLLQYQRVGGFIFNELKDVIIVFLASVMVLNGQLTLGTLVAVSYVIGQLAGPLEQMIRFFGETQDARLSLDRLAEIHTKPDEEPEEKMLITHLPQSMDLVLENVTFQYEGPHSPKVLDAVQLLIPNNKITAIVGVSGSGKTTLLKLLLGFYTPVDGYVNVGDHRLRNISQQYWRSQCGTVLQDGFLFTDSIAKNISLSDEKTDKERLYYASKVAGVMSIVNELPLGFNTIIGQEGHGLSQGQKQRILIARAVYKNPDYLFLDEATNSLDANTEKVIMENLQEFFKGRTVVIVAHRLSTVKNADQIIVLDKGGIAEIGTHQKLTAARGQYYHLVKNQLELGK